MSLLRTIYCFNKIFMIFFFVKHKFYRRSLFFFLVDTVIRKIFQTYPRFGDLPFSHQIVSIYYVKFDQHFQVKFFFCLLHNLGSKKKQGCMIYANVVVTKLCLVYKFTLGISVFNHNVPITNNAPILYPLKTPKKRMFSGFS